MLGTKIEPQLNWQDIDTVLLDMDGTLLDKHFDDYFWETHVPEEYAAKHNISILDAEEKLLATYKEEEGTLSWADLNFWSDKLQLDIPAMKKKLNHLIQVHPYVAEFLDFCQATNKKSCLVTDAHPETLQIKMDKTGLAEQFDTIVCAEELGCAKSEEAFWPKLAEKLAFDKGRTLLVDDNEKVLLRAKEFGLAQLIFMAKSSSTKPVRYSKEFPSIIFFKEITEQP